MDNVDSEDPTKYKRLLTEIRTWLDGGMFKPGDPIPSITELAADRGWSRQTCARAMLALLAEGRLKRYPGIGYHVSRTSNRQSRP